jgi:hypothetical protein
MSDTDRIPVTCNDCDERVELYECPYDPNNDYIVTCDCDLSIIDVSNSVNGNNLLDPLTGQWSSLDDDVL